MLKAEDEVRIINCPPISARKRFTLRHIIHSPELQRESLRSGKDYQTALARLNEQRDIQEGQRRAAAKAKQLEEMKAAREERIEEERRRGEAKKAARKKVPFTLTAARQPSPPKPNSPRI